jgi:UDP-N-acetylglucosamine 2-epimerase (non-hydrolysing)
MSRTVLTVFGTRPEIIKLAPVISALEARPEQFRTINVASGQHTELLFPFVPLLDVRVDHDLGAMRPRQALSRLCARILTGLDRLLARTRPDVVLVQGDTTTTLAGALAAAHRGIAVGHVEAGLRSDDRLSPFPEEQNRRLISILATFHFAPTPRNRARLVSEGVDPDRIVVTGNPVVDALHRIRERPMDSSRIAALRRVTEGQRRIVVTTHRRERFGAAMAENLRALRAFVVARPDTALIFPVHPNPRVQRAARRHLHGHPRIHLVPPLPYDEFIAVLGDAWLIVSDSGGVQEEAPTLGKPLLVIRDTTERPEVLEAGVGRLVGQGRGRLAAALVAAEADAAWPQHCAQATNPFGRGDAGPRIADALERFLDASRGVLTVAGRR